MKKQNVQTLENAGEAKKELQQQQLWYLLFMFFFVIFWYCCQRALQNHFSYMQCLILNSNSDIFVFYSPPFVIGHHEATVENSLLDDEVKIKIILVALP